MAELAGVEWLPGHVVNGVLLKFYHLCPGKGCAIGDYLQRLGDLRALAQSDEERNRMQPEGAGE